MCSPLVRGLPALPSAPEVSRSGLLALMDSLSVKAQNPAVAIASLYCADEALPRTPDRWLGLRGNFAWTLLGNGVYAATQWALLVVIAKLGAPELVGRFALGLAVCAPVFLLSRLALRPVQASDARGEYQFGHYLALRIASVPVAIVGVGIVLAIVGYRQEVTWVVLAVAVAKACESLSDPLYGAFQQRERMDYIAQSMIVKGLLALAAFALAFVLTRELEWSVAGLATAWAAVLFLFDFRKAAAFLTPAELRPRWEPKALSDLARLALPVGLAAMLLSLHSNVPRYFVERLLGEHALGVYAALAYPILAVGTVVNALGQSASPRLARLYADRNAPGYLKLLLRIVLFGVALSTMSMLVVAVFGKELLEFFYRPEYGNYADLFLLFTVTLLLASVASFLGYGMTAARLFVVQPILFAIALVVGCVSSYYWIPAHGLKGAVAAYGACLAVQALGGLLCTLAALRRIRSDETAGPVGRRS